MNDMHKNMIRYYMEHRFCNLNNKRPTGLYGHLSIRRFLGHHCYRDSLSDICLGVEKKILKEIMHFHYMTHMATP